MAQPGKDLSTLFSLRKNFTIIGLTGQQGSRYEDIAEQLSQGFDDSFELPESFNLGSNSYKKYNIIYRFAKENFHPFKLIKYNNIVVLYLLKYDFNVLMKFVESVELSLYASRFKSLPSVDFSEELKSLEGLRLTFNKFKHLFDSFNEYNFESDRGGLGFSSLFFSHEFSSFCEDFHQVFQGVSFVKHYLLFDLLTNNIRKTGHPFSGANEEVDPTKVFSLAELLNLVIKLTRKNNNGAFPAKIAIDSLRVPLEILFFRQRYSAFYLVAVNKDDDLRERIIDFHYKQVAEDAKKLFEDEYTGGKGGDFFKKYIRECIEKADIHITHRSKEEAERLNRRRDDSTSPYFSWKMQLLKYVSLIEHPGLVTPSPEERSMQLAYAARCSSGCISRQVGAAITDEDYSIKAIGWNNTPQGQTPCLLRNGEVLLNSSYETIDKERNKEKKVEKALIVRHNLQSQIESDPLTTKELVEDEEVDQQLFSFTPYEKSTEFKGAFEALYTSQLDTNRNLLKGRNMCFCFKSVKNSFSEGKNQVHTRSLHAEENAFLQITKYGGTGVKNGKLFTTASPCELCSKKAYQLGIKVIYYLDPYPGISTKQILNVGKISRSYAYSMVPSVTLTTGCMNR